MDPKHPLYVVKHIQQFVHQVNNDPDSEGEVEIKFIERDPNDFSQVIGLACSNRAQFDHILLTFVGTGSEPIFPLIGLTDESVWTMFTFGRASTAVILAVDAALDSVAQATAHRFLNQQAKLEMLRGLDSMPDTAADFLKKANGRG